MIDYLIVGSGLAGISFSEILFNNNKSFIVFDNDSQHSSVVAGGLYNPVILKRFSEVWKAKEQLEFSFPFYKIIEDRLKVEFDFKVPIYRRFFSVEEQNNWFIAADKPNLAPFLSTNLITSNYKGIDAPFGYGEVLNTGYLDVACLLSAYKSFLHALNALSVDTFDYSKILIHNDHIEYKGITTKNIVFAEGFGLNANPFFNHLPLDGTKGELLIIKCPTLTLDVIVNTSIFILPLGNHLFKVGATYNWSDKSNIPTQEGKDELLNKLSEFLNCDFEVIEHLAGVRPTVKDRRPLVGTHPEHSNIHILNGLGTRGVMLAPFLAKALFDNIENNITLDKEINIDRFRK